MSLGIEHKRFRQIREKLKFTQVEFAEQLGIASSTADIERGRVRISGKIVSTLLSKYSINPLWLFGESQKVSLNPHQTNVMPKAITVNEEGHENMLMVPLKAAAGYGQNIGDATYINTLPSFHFPLPEYRNATFRGFQITGDSMSPWVKSGDWVLVRAVDSFADVKSGQVYVVVEEDSIRLKEIQKNADGIHLQLISWNPEYAPVEITSEAILELWEYHSKISIGMDKSEELTLEKVYNEVKKLKGMLR